ncbi:hypothetical protein [Acidisoma cladoniae]|uniref:hypothetical protein n=1 Tax=Acidisoma cladoniae TaxID=3040935 RepID=UPI00254ADB94|nr:hypothetical protein [Acidisoma sp. PAMC 29798]
MVHLDAVLCHHFLELAVADRIREGAEKSWSIRRPEARSRPMRFFAKQATWEKPAGIAVA